MRNDVTERSIVKLENRRDVVKLHTHFRFKLGNEIYLLFSIAAKKLNAMLYLFPHNIDFQSSTVNTPFVGFLRQFNYH